MVDAKIWDPSNGMGSYVFLKLRNKSNNLGAQLRTRNP